MRPLNGFPNFQQKVELPKELVPALIEALQDKEKRVRQYAASALARVGKDAVGPLLALLKGKDKSQRANAAYVLGHLGAAGQEALPLLLKALKDEDAAVRVRAAFAVERLVAAAKKAVPSGMPAYAQNMMGRQVSKPSVVLPADPGTVAPTAREKVKPKKGGKDE
jgi:hypothetical protein